MPLTGTLPQTGAVPPPEGRFAVKLVLADTDKDLFLAAGARGIGAIYTHHLRADPHHSQSAAARLVVSQLGHHQAPHQPALTSMRTIHPIVVLVGCVVVAASACAVKDPPPAADALKESAARDDGGARRLDRRRSRRLASW